MIKGSISLLVKDGVIDVSSLKTFIPEDIVDKFFPSDRLAAGQSFKFVIGDTKVQMKWHSPDLLIRQQFPKSNSGRAWTAQIRVGKHWLLSNGKWSARKGVQKSSRAHIPVINR